jgi:hypothetical protein
MDSIAAKLAAHKPCVAEHCVVGKSNGANIQSLGHWCCAQIGFAGVEDTLACAYPNMYALHTFSGEAQVCMYVCMYVCVYIYIYIYTHEH